MGITKMCLANTQGKLSRQEMKKIMAGSGAGKSCSSECTKDGAKYSCYSDAGDGTNCYCTVQRGLSCS